MKNIAIVYHRIDFDGICSCAIVRDYIEAHNMRPVLFPYNHGDAVPEARAFNDCSEVWMVDIILPVDLIKELRKSRRRVVVIDHHETSIRSLKAAGLNRLPGLQVNDRMGACELCWRYLYGPAETPRPIALLSAYDVWDKARFNWEHFTLPFQYAMRNRFGLDAELFYKRFKSGFFDHDDYEVFNGLLTEGKAVLKYVLDCGRRAAQNYSFEVTIGGETKALCLLTDTGGSLPFNEVAREKGCKVVITVNRVKDDTFKMSCYATEDDCPIHLGNYLLETYGGGGHRDAAGATINTEQFLRLIQEKIV